MKDKNGPQNIREKLHETRKGELRQLSTLSCAESDARQETTADNADPKKPRRSQRVASQTTPLKDKGKGNFLPSPLTHKESTVTDRELTASPPEGRPSQIRHRTPPTNNAQNGYNSEGGLSSPPSDTQPLSQFLYPGESRLSYEVDDEEAEGVWGYLVPIDDVFGETLVLRSRSACPAPYPSGTFGKGSKKRGKGQANSKLNKEEKDYEADKIEYGFPSGGYLIGRHPECGEYLCIRVFSMPFIDAPS